MSSIEVKLDASAAVAALSRRFGAISARIPPALRMAVNDAGDRTKSAMKRPLAVQTGLKPKVIAAALKTTRAGGAGGSTYVIASRGGDIRLKFFAARETRRGVSAAPRSQRRVFAGTFIHGGRFPNRHGGPGKSGHAYYRRGSGRFPIKVARSGVFIPEDMVRGATAAAFNETSRRVLPERIAHHLRRAMG